MKFLLATLLLTLPLAAMADSTWSGEGDLGFNKSTGNTQSESLVSNLKVIYEVNRWTHTGQIEAVNTSDTGERTAESYVARLSDDFAISEKYYAFGNSRYEETRFSGYDYQASLAAGLGIHFINTDTTVFNLAGGPGYRRSKEEGTGITTEEGIFQVTAKFYSQLTDTTRFESDFAVESGAENVRSEAALALKVRMNSHLALKLGYLVKNNSDVPADAGHTDTLTSVALNYSF